MKHRLSKTSIATLGLLAAVLSTNSLFAQQAGYPSVFIDGVHYIPETAQAAAVIAPSSVVVGGGAYVVPASTARASTPLENNRNGHFGFGAGVYILKPEHSDSMNHYGLSFGGGFTAVPSSIGQIRFHFDLGFYYWQKDYGYGYKTKDFAMPLLSTLGYEFNLGSPHFRGRVGAVLGGTTFINDNGDETAAAVAFSYGVDLGITYTPVDTFYLDLGYRFIGNSEASFKYDKYTYKMKSSAQQVSFSIGWRF